MINFKECVNDLLRVFYNKDSLMAKTDPLLNQRANSVKDFYKGYPYIIRWGPDKDKQWVKLAAINDWCQKNCKGKFTTHIHRVVYDEWNGGWTFNGIGGADYCFWAFEYSEDAVMFSLVC